MNMFRFDPQRWVQLLAGWGLVRKGTETSLGAAPSLVSPTGFGSPKTPKPPRTSPVNYLEKQ